MRFKELFGRVVNHDFFDEVSSFDGVDHALPLSGFSENCVLSIKVRSGAVGDEELGAVGIRSGVGHGEDSSLVMSTMGLALAFEFIAGVASSSSQWAATLDHEVRDDAVKAKPIIVSA